MPSHTADDGTGTALSRRRSVLQRVPVVWLLLAIVLVAAAAARPQQVRTTLTSPRALLVLAVIVLLTVLLRRLGRRLPAPLASVLSAAPAVLAIAVLVVPTLRSTTVDEDLAGLDPGTSADAVTTGSTGDPEAPAADRQPVRLATGEVVGIGHRGSGSASLVELANGDLVLRFEDLDVDPGPDYRVYLVPGSDKESPDGGVELAPLKANRGNQNYALDSASADRPVTALIWCEAFSVPIAAASLT